MHRRVAVPKKYEHINFVPPEGVANAAEKGLKLRAKASPSNRGGLTPAEASKQGIGSGVQRAVNLKNRDPVSPKVVKQMRGFLSRSEKSSEISEENKGTPWNDKGYVAWLLWGGDPAKAWVAKIIGQMEAADEKAKQSKQAALMGKWGSFLCPTIREAGLLQPPPQMTEEITNWVLSCWAKTVLAIYKAKGKRHFNERYMERLVKGDSKAAVIRRGSPEKRRFPMDLTGWRYGDRSERIFQKEIASIAERMDMFRSAPGAAMMKEYLDSMEQTQREYLDSGMPLLVEIEHKPKQSGNFTPVTNRIYIAFHSETTEEWLRKVVAHEMRHYAQALLTQSIEHSTGTFEAGLPSRSIRTPQYSQNPSSPHAETESYLHALDDVEFYTNLADAVERMRMLLQAIPEEYDENTGKMDSRAREARFKELVGYRIGSDTLSFFKNLKRNRKAHGKWKKAVSEAYAALVDDVFSGGGSRFRLAARVVERWASDNEPSNPGLWAKVQALTKGEKASITVNGKKVNGPNEGEGFDVFPSAYANGWASKTYKDLGGKWKKKASTGDGSEHVGVFAPLPADLAGQFPEKGEDSSVAHVTLCYIGPVPDKQDQKVLVESVRDLYADVVGPIKARLSGVDYFRSATGSVAYTKVVFSKDMGSLKDRLKSLLEDHGIEISDDHPLAFNPHVTLAYYEDPHAVWDGPVPKGSWTFNEVEVWGLPEVHRLPVGRKDKMESEAGVKHASLTEAWGPTFREARGKWKKTGAAAEDCDAMVSTAWVSPQGKMVFLRGQSHEDFAEKWALRNEPELHSRITEYAQTARPHASIWHRVLLDRGWLQLQGMSSIVVPPRPSRKQLQNVADLFANCIADGTSNPDRITLHIMGLDPALRGKSIQPGEDRYPFGVQERVSLADFIEREASGPVIEDMYESLMERPRRASLREAARPPFDDSIRGPSEGTARLSDVTFEVRGREPFLAVRVRSGDGLLGEIEATLTDQAQIRKHVDGPDRTDDLGPHPEKSVAGSLRDLGERVGRPDMGVYTVGSSNLWDTFHGYGVGKRAYMVLLREAYKRGHAVGPDASWYGRGFSATSPNAQRVWKKLGAMPGVEVAADHPFYFGNPKDERVGPDRPRGFRREKKRYKRRPKHPTHDRVARGKAKKDVGHGGLDEWFSGHGGAKGKGEDATWGDWVSISPVTKTLPSGKKVEKGDIVGECGISDDADWKEITKGGEDPLKCMPRQKAHDMPKAERAEKAKAKQRAEKADSSRGKKPTMTPTFDKKKGKKARLQRIQMKREASARLRSAWGKCSD